MYFCPIFNIYKRSVISSLYPRIYVAGMTDTRIDVLASEDHANVPMTPLGVVPTGKYPFLITTINFLQPRLMCQIESRIACG